MKKLIPLLFILFACQKEQVTPSSEIEITHPLPNNVQQIGRKEWGGYYLKTQINGTITINIPDPGNWYFYQLNGVTHRITSTDHITGVGQLVITQSKDYHYGFSAWLSPGPYTPAKIEKKVTYIGDSITIGYLLQDVTNSYPWLCGYDHIQIAYPGIRLIDMEKQFFMSAPKGGTPIAPAKTDLIVINLGTNDAIANKDHGVTPDNVFKASYKRFIEHIREYYSGKILLLRPFNGSKSGVIHQVADEYGNVIYLDTYGWLSKTNTIDGLHPNDLGNKLIAVQLKKWIDKYL